MKEIVILRNDAGQRLDRFLVKAFPKLTQGYICGAVRKKRIKVCNKRAEPSYKLAENDTVQLYISDELLETKKNDKNDFFQAEDELCIIYEDSNILLVDKVPGLVVHEDDENTADTLINRIKKYLFVKDEYKPDDEQSFTPALCNRIDRNTGGIVIAAKNAEALRILNQKIKGRELQKLYLCIVLGQLPKKEDTLTAYLEKNSETNTVIVSGAKAPRNLTIKTKYRVIDSFGDLSLVEADLLTGRTHQIRAHFAYIGHPLLGDGKYGRNAENKRYGLKYQALYSYVLKFKFTSHSGSLSYLNGKTFSVPNVWLVDKYNSYKKEGINKK